MNKPLFIGTSICHTHTHTHTHTVDQGLTEVGVKNTLNHIHNVMIVKELLHGAERKVIMDY